MTITRGLGAAWAPAAVEAAGPVAAAPAETDAPLEEAPAHAADAALVSAHASERVAVAIALVLEELVIDQEQGGRHRRFQSRIDILRITHREIVGVRL